MFAGSGDAGKVGAFSSRLGRPVAYAHDFLDKRTWNTMTDIQPAAQHWTDAGFGGRMVFSVPMFPDSGGTLAAGAAGEYNGYFRTLGQRLVAGGQAGATLRIGPEFNGKWFRWTIDQNDGPRLFVAYWRQIVATLRAVPGANFKFDWCANNGSAYANNGSGQLEAADAYPGDDVVDYIGLDVYDQSWSPNGGDPAVRWNEFLDLKNGLRWHANFAAAHGKPMTFPEWGLADRADGHGGGDNPYFIERMFEWIHHHNVAYSLYFEGTDPNGTYGVFSGRFPRAAQRFVDLFGPHYVEPGTDPATPASVPEDGDDGTGSAGEPADSSPHWGTGSPGTPASTTAVEQPTSQTDGLTGSGSHAAGNRAPANLRVKRARLRAGARRLDVVAKVSSSASGTVVIRFRAAGRTRRYTTSVNSRAQIRLYARVPRRLAIRPGTVSLRYAGDADTRAASVRVKTRRG